MSWSREDDYAAFKAAASSYNSPNPRPWSLLVWDVTHGKRLTLDLEASRALANRDSES